MPGAARKVGKHTRVAAQRDVPRIGLGLLLREADMAFNRALRDELAKHRISFSQYQHLRHLWQSDGLAQVELSRRIGIETASSTAVLDQLDKRALIRRQRDPRDRRRIIVTLTPAGRALERPLESCAVAVNKRARAKLSTAQVAALFDIMKTIIGNVRPPVSGGRKNAR
jgi:DNA-binding MarR family transcriptional regulator